MSNQVIVIGGAVMGSALAYWLTRLDPSVGVTVIERDPSYAHASSALSAASIRQQFSTPVNIRVSQASVAFLRNAAVELGIDDEKPDVMLREAGYLYLAGAAGAAELRQAHAVQKACGADVALMDRADLERRFGWLNTSDHNAILGPHPSLENFLFMNGFSGHGMQQAPVIGRAIAELILLGRFETLDLSDLLFARIAENRPLREANVIG
jgi:glycine/D-amino acid oxidase-like deaminating enzyme